MATPRPPRPPADPAPTWQPIGRPPLVATSTDGMLADDRQTHANLLEARPWPAVPADATVTRTRRVFTEQRAGLDPYAGERVSFALRERRGGA